MVRSPFAKPGPQAKLEFTLEDDMTWGDIKDFAESVGVPSNAKLDIYVDRPINPTPLDRGNPPMFKFSWDVQRREYPSD